MLLFSWGLVGLFLFLQLRSQVDHYAVQDIETVEGLLFFDSVGTSLELREDYHNHAESKQVLEWLLEVRSPDGDVLYRNERLGSRSLGGIPFSGEGVGGYSVRSVRLTDGTRVRLVSRRHSLDGHVLVIRLAYSEEADLDAGRRTGRGFVAGIAHRAGDRRAWSVTGSHAGR